MRNCFMPPIAEINTAIDLLKLAADAYINGDFKQVGALLEKADIAEVAEFYKRIAGVTDPEIHWQTSQPKSLLPKSRRTENRMPSAKLEYEIFNRDGWRCRFCNTRVISRKARAILIKQFPAETHWVSSEFKRHAALHSQAASLDHVLPHSRGGTNDPENLVTACGPCQFGRNRWTLEEVGFNDPRLRPPVVDDWDGLISLERVK